MILLLSGEGPSDIGALNHDQTFEPGPMAWFVEKIVETIWNYSPLGTDAVEFVSEDKLSKESRGQRKSLVLPGKKRKNVGTAYFYKNARALARLAKGKESGDGCEVAAVLFRDADGTRSTVEGLWESKVKSIVDGFAAEKYERGVPMVPKPKSEAWLICALKTTPYQSCAGLEDDLPGNDNAPRPAKAILEEFMKQRGEDAYSTGVVNDWIADGTIDPTRIDMPSFKAFRDRLAEVANAMIGRSRNQ